MAGEYIDFEAQVKQINKIKERMGRIRRKLLVMSGKGGVGKTTITVNLANALVDAGRRVGVLDTDLHGPNVAKMFGVEGRLMETEDGTSLFPVEPRPGLKVVSLSFALPDPDAPIVWRGPMKLAAIKQFLADVEWGDLDYLLVDTPPGTGDEPLAVAQNLPGLSGSIIVTTPQAVAVADSRKSVTFSRRLGVPILGVVENMSGLRCPHCGHEIPVFGIGGGKVMAEDMSVPFLGRVPMEIELREAEDAGTSWVSEPTSGPSAAALREMAAYIDALEDDYLKLLDVEAKKMKAEADEAEKQAQEAQRDE